MYFSESLELELIEAESAKRYVEAQGIHDKTVALKKKSVEGFSLSVSSKMVVLTVNLADISRIEVVREEEVANSNSLLQDELDQTYEREKESLTALWQEKLEEFERKAAENASELEVSVPAAFQDSTISFLRRQWKEGDGGLFFKNFHIKQNLGWEGV